MDYSKRRRSSRTLLQQAADDMTAAKRRPSRIVHVAESSDRRIAARVEAASRRPFEGGHGAISVTANVAPRLCADLHDAWRRGEPKAALAIHERLMPLHQALFIESSPAPTKYALARLGKNTGELRLPLVECSENAKRAIDDALTAAGVI
jgi:dihydrodipicolinate synthase/N-acetylneuraminate lyase